MRRAATWLALGALLPACTLLAGSFDGYASDAPSNDGGVIRDSSLASEVSSTVDGGVGEEASTGTSYRDLVLSDGPIAYFRLGEPATSATIRDEVTGQTSDIAGAVTRGAPGAIANDPDTSMSFDANASVRVTGSTMNFPDFAAFSIECWIKPSLVDSDYRRVVSNEGTNEAGRQGWLLWVVDRTNGGIGFERYVNGIGSGVLSRSIPPPDRWTHVVATYDGALLSLYVDGALVESDESPKPLVGQSLLRLGTSVAPGIVGGLDEVAIYGRALPRDRIVAHHASGAR